MVRVAQPMPAALTRPRSSPSSLAASTAAITSSGSATLAWTNTPRVSLAIASPLSSCMSTTTTLAPRCASRRAVAAPRPEPPPVTIAEIPLMSMPRDCNPTDSACRCAAGAADLHAGSELSPHHDPEVGVETDAGLVGHLHSVRIGELLLGEHPEPAALVEGAVPRDVAVRGEGDRGEASLTGPAGRRVEQAGAEARALVIGVHRQLLDVRDAVELFHQHEPDDHAVVLGDERAAGLDQLGQLGQLVGRIVGATRDAGVVDRTEPLPRGDPHRPHRLDVRRDGGADRAVTVGQRSLRGAGRAPAVARCARPGGAR